jgi:hypothetical protein
VHVPDVDNDSIALPIKVYMLRFIDGANAKRKTSYSDAQGTEDPVLFVSREVTDKNIVPTTSGNTDAERYDGPASSDVAGILRMQVDTLLSGDDSAKFRIVRVPQSQTVDTLYDVLWDGVPDPSAPVDSAPWRLKNHLRLVSNAKPSAPPPNSQYDDDVLGDQTIKIRLGDWIKATLLVVRNGQEETVGSTFLPVGRPPGEKGQNTDIVITGALRVTRIQHLGWPVPTWDPIASERASEDFAQVRVRLRVGEVVASPKQEARNTALIIAPVLEDGYLRVSYKVDGQQQPDVDAPVARGDSVDQASDKLQAALVAAGLDVVAYTGRMTGSAALNDKFLSLRSQGDYDRVEITKAATWKVNGQPAAFPVVDYIHVNGADGEIETMESYVMAMELKSLSQEDVDVLVWPIDPATGSIVPFSHPYDGSYALAFAVSEKQTLDVPDRVWFPEACNTLQVPTVLVDEDDAQWPTAFGHELGHILLDGNYHETISTHLMYLGLGLDLDPETPATAKRLPPTGIDPYSWIWEKSGPIQQGAGDPTFLLQSLCFD